MLILWKVIHTLKNNQIIYNKLIRDNIPQIITDNNMKYNTHIANDVEYREMLIKKLVEEVNEFIQDPCSDEMADVLEVLGALRTVYNLVDLEEVKEEKYCKKGGFEKRIILESVWEDW